MTPEAITGLNIVISIICLILVLLFAAAINYNDGLP